MLCYDVHAKQFPNCTGAQPEAELRVEGVASFLWKEDHILMSASVFTLLSPPPSFVY